MRKNKQKLDPDKKRFAIKIFKYAILALAAAAACTAIVVFLVPLIFHISLVPQDGRSIAMLFVLLSLVYFALLMIIRRFWSFSKVQKATVAIISSAIATILMIGAVYIANTFLFLKSTEVSEYDNVTYAVVVRDNSDYMRIGDLENKKIGLLTTDDDSGVIHTLEQSTGLSFKIVNFDNGIEELGSALTDKRVEAIVIESGRLNFLNEELEDFEEGTRIIYTFKFEKSNYKTEEPVAITSPFVIYISGIDQFGQTDSVVGRSDVNQLMVVNPETHTILFVNTPRDYYVQLAGTTGLKDKLTHAGVYGIETSIKTLEELYGVKINYYVRVNFDSLIKVVDKIGGIEVVSDQSFKALHGNNVYVKEGLNYFNGDQALAYARERYAYESGDRHRGENQQQVMAAIIDKVSTSSVLLSDYNGILQSLSGSFQTDMPSDVLIDLFQQQASTKTEWKIENISVDGTGDMLPTYSMGANLPLYVMIPNEETVTQAKVRIAEVMNGE